MKQTIIKTVIAAFAVHLCIALAIGMSVDVNSYRRGEKIGNSTPTIVSGANDVCITPGCHDAALKVLKNMDPSVKPCDNFYRFACGRFLNETVIPDDKASVTTFSVIRDKVQEQLRSSLEEPSTSNEPKHFRLVKNLYKSCINNTAIEEKGLDPLRKILNKLGGWPVLERDSWNESSFNWINLVYKFRDLGYSINYFLKFKVTKDSKNSTKRVISFDQASLGLSYEYLSRGIDNKIVKAYYSYMVDVAVILGAERDRAKEELLESLKFEIQLANISLPNEKRRNITILYNLMTIAELTKNYSHIPWKEYVNHLLPPSIRVDDDEIAIVAVPNFIKNLQILLDETPKRIQANYGIWRAVAASVSDLNDEIRKRELKFSTVLTGKTKKIARWKECVDLVSDNLPISVGALYVRKYFDENAKKTVMEMVDVIRKQFNKTLEKVDWMDDETRKSALDKAASMSSYIAYPDEILDDKKMEELYEGLEIDGNDYFQGILNLTIFGTENAFGSLRKPVSKNDWVKHGDAAAVNAFYSPRENSIRLPAGVLQDVFFSNDRPNYMNYGAIGFSIGHEISHGFDDKGRQFDKMGNLVDWWAPTTAEKYLAKVQCIINQYGNYTVEEVGLNLNGIKSQGENIADNGGIKTAYLAYKDWSDRNGPESMLPNLTYTPRQMFWISAANKWCSVYRPQALKRRITTGSHSPGEFRILGPFSNMPEFAEDFECPVGSKMNPEHKCSVW